MDKLLESVVNTTLRQMITEAPAQETDNSASDSSDSLFTPAEEKFLGKFDAYGTNHLGIIYSVSDIGIREFIGRAGKDLNVTPQILLNLLRRKIIRIVPYTGWGRNNDYTIELNLSLDDVAGLGEEDKKKVETGQTGGGGGGAAMPTEPTEPAPEVAWVVKYGDILHESAKITKVLLNENKKNKLSDKHIMDKSRILHKLPDNYIKHMNRIIKIMDTKTKSVSERERLIADVLDILQLKLKLTPKQIQQSYDYHKTQKRLQKYLDKN
jgi:hypothetical protein